MLNTFATFLYLIIYFVVILRHKKNVPFQDTKYFILSLFRVSAANVTDHAPRHYEVHPINSVSIVCVQKTNSLSL